MDTSDNKRKDPGSLEEQLGHVFKDRSLLDRALTHRSHVNEKGDHAPIHNERLEFLGDAVIDLCIGHHLMQVLPGAREGQLSKLRAAVVSEASLARVGTRLDLGEYLLLGRGEEQTGGRQKVSIVSDAFEALIGALFIDAGYPPADQIVRCLLEPLVNDAIAGVLDRDHKTRLQELAQARKHQLPRYDVVGETGPDHAKTFDVAVFVDDAEVARAEGHSKKEAEQRAARLALAVLEALLEEDTNSGR